MDSREQENRPMPEAIWRYTLTEEEIYAGLTCADTRRRGKGRPWLQSVVLALLALFCFIAFFGEGMKTPGSLILALLACALIAAVWLVPSRVRRNGARREAGEARPVTVCLFADGLAFGGEEEPVYAFSRFPAQLCGDLAVCELPGHQLILIPRRVMEENEWQTLISRLRKE